MRRWAVSVVGVIGLLALAFLLAHAPQRTPGLTEAKFKRVQRGVTLEQAEAILGGFARYNPGPAAHYWYGDSGTAFVVLDEVGRVKLMGWRDGSPEYGPLGHVHAWLFE